MGRVCLRNLGRYRFRSLADDELQLVRVRRLHPKATHHQHEGPNPEAAGVLNLQLLLDKLLEQHDVPEGVSNLAQLVRADDAVEPTSAAMFDLDTMLQPPVDPSASPARLAKNLKYQQQRIQCALAPFKRCSGLQVDGLCCTSVVPTCR